MNSQPLLTALISEWLLLAWHDYKKQNSAEYAALGATTVFFRPLPRFRGNFINCSNKLLFNFSKTTKGSHFYNKSADASWFKVVPNRVAASQDGLWDRNLFFAMHMEKLQFNHSQCLRKSCGPWSGLFFPYFVPVYTKTWWLKCKI